MGAPRDQDGNRNLLPLVPNLVGGELLIPTQDPDMEQHQEENADPVDLAVKQELERIQQQVEPKIERVDGVSDEEDISPKSGASKSSSSTCFRESSPEEDAPVVVVHQQPADYSISDEEREEREFQQRCRELE